MMATFAASKQILVVDDEAYVREAIADILSYAGLDVLEATNGEEALIHYSREGESIDAVILDMQMPIMDGSATLYALRELDPSVRIIISSGYAQSSKIHHFVEQGWASFLPKPYDMATLINKVETTLNKPSLSA